MEGVIQASANDINNKKYFPAAKKIIFAENIGKKNADCFEDFQVHYKKLSIFMKFLVYIARPLLIRIRYGKVCDHLEKCRTQTRNFLGF